MRIVDNISALRVHTNLTRTGRAIDRSTMRLSSGQRINSAGDDPAGFAISLHMRHQVRGMGMADRNTLDGRSLLETADAALQDMHNMLHRIRELAVQAANDTYNDQQREVIQMEIDQLLSEINDTTNKVEFNNIKLLNGEAQNLRVQVGSRRGMSIALTIPSMRTWDIGPMSDPPNPGLDGLTSQNWYMGSADPAARRVNVYDHPSAQETIAAVDAALDHISWNRAEIGAFINRFEYTSTSLTAAIEATTRSLSRVFDTDMAYEMMMLSKNNIMSQAGMSIMAQANARPQQILQLLG
ncbi:MAG: flagellin [Defluviitaleaceae bacterium]|nr:flagellin [Defluviitaleaceae bacterium]